MAPRSRGSHSTSRWSRSARSAVVLYVVLGPIVVEGGENALQTAFSVAYPVGDMVLLAGLASLATRRSPRSATRALQFFGAGLLCWVAADLVYGYITLHGTYRGGDPVDSMWLVAMALFAIAGTAQRSLESDVDAESAGLRRGRAARPISRCWSASVC